MSVWAEFSIGALILGALLVAVLLRLDVALLRLEWRIEEEEGVHEATGEHPAREHKHEPTDSKSHVA